MQQLKLIAPDSYRALTSEQRKKFINGCGPGGWKADIVPDKILGVCITEACNIHDWMYTCGKSEYDRERADIDLLDNILLIIEADSSWFGSRLIRRGMALTYYNAVREMGSEFFWTCRDENGRKKVKPQ